MHKRQIIIGAFGGDRQKSVGEEFGAAVARAGYILLTGGDIRDCDEIKNATMIGAARSEDQDRKVVARLIGILPDGPREWLHPCHTRLFLKTGLPHYVRNVINGMTPDVIVAFGGGPGTLAEVAFAKAAGKEVIFYGALKRLNRDLRKYFNKPEVLDTL
jgi:predicted Rossmann-fold nucleotide-binding protein